jgi:hypothetical protein
MSQGGDLFAPSIFMAVPSNNIVARIGRPRFRSHSFCVVIFISNTRVAI